MSTEDVDVASLSFLASLQFLINYLSQQDHSRFVTIGKSLIQPAGSLLYLKYESYFFTLFGFKMIIYLTPYMNGRTTTQGVFKAYVFFCPFVRVSVSCPTPHVNSFESRGLIFCIWSEAILYLCHRNIFFITAPPV